MDLTLAQAVVPGLERGSFMLKADCHAAVLRAVQAGLGIGVATVPWGARSRPCRRSPARRCGDAGDVDRGA